MQLRAICALLLCATLASAQRYKSLEEAFSWKVLEYGFPTYADRQYAVNNGLMTKNTGTPIDVDIQYTGLNDFRVFITIPRFSAGIPYTLGLVSDTNGPNGPIIDAYPNYQLQRGDNPGCNGIISAFRTRIDECNQMWVIDSGIVNGVQICPPQVHIINLYTDRIIKSFNFSPNVYTPGKSLLISLAVDVRDPPPFGTCRNAMVYITDVKNHGMVVYDSLNNDAWRVENPLLYPDPAWGKHTVAGETFTLNDGPFAINLSPRMAAGDERYIFFHSLASPNENVVPQHVVDNRAIWKANPRAQVAGFQVLGNRGVQVSQEAMDSRGNLFGLTNDALTLFAWNIETPYTFNYFRTVANNPVQLQFASGMKVIRNPNGYDELWTLTCRFQKVSLNELNPSETNFRILTCATDDLLSGRGCGYNAAYGPVSNDLRV